MRSGPRGRGGALAAAAVFVLVTVPLLQFRYGYQSGTNDHFVLSLQGLQWGRRGFLVNDWFIASAPQPHVLFDLVTWAGAATDRLSEVYLAWWLLGLAVGGVATAVLAVAWTPRHPVVASAVVGGLIVLGPQIVLGSTSPALPTALPHELGGFLAYLTGALLLTRRPRPAALALIATAAVHVQLGALAAVVGLLAFAVVAITERVRWWSLLAGVVVAGGLVVAVLRMRPVAAEGDDFVQICREVIPYHCDATTWSASQFSSGAAVVGAALLCLGYVWRGGRTAVGLWAAVVLVPALGLTLGVLAGRYDVPVAGRLAQSTNIFRLAALLVPFAAWGLYVGFARLTSWRRIGWLLLAVPAGYGWLVARDGAPVLPDAPREASVVLAVAVLAVLARGLPSSGVAGELRAVWVALAGAAAVALLVRACLDAGTLADRPVRPTFVASASDRAMGVLIARHVPVGEEVLVPPTLGVVRLTSGRSIVVDCKAVPYGGAAWREYRERLDALGGRDSCHSGGRPFLEVTPAELTATALRYGARYLVLTGRDTRVRPIQALGWRVLQRPRPNAGDMWVLAAPGAPDARSWAPEDAP